MIKFKKSNTAPQKLNKKKTKNILIRIMDNL